MQLSFSNGGGSGTSTASLSASAASYGHYEYIYDPVAGVTRATYVPANSADSKSKLLTVIFANNTDQTQYAMLSLSALVSGTSGTASAGPLDSLPIPVVSSANTVLPELQQIGTVAGGGQVFGVVTSVPEPSTWALMGLGLVEIGRAHV